MDRQHDNLIRAETGVLGLRSDTEDGMPTMVGRFAAPGEWTEIKSVVEGHFMERFAATAFEKTIKESTKNMRVLYHHGHDPYFGNAVLGTIRALDASTDYEVDLLDTDYNKRLVPQLRSGQLGSSFRFAVVKEEVEETPERSDFNPQQLPQVTITEAKVREFGPTPMPAYATTSAGLRSITDEFLLAQLQEDPERLTRLVEALRAAALQPVKPEPVGDSTSLASEPQHSAETETREEDKPTWFLE
jgi:HK97 family phage prohead protease